MKNKYKKISGSRYVASVLANLANEGETKPFWQASEAARAKNTSFKTLQLRIRKLSDCVIEMSRKLEAIRAVPNCKVTVIDTKQCEDFKEVIEADYVLVWTGKYWLTERRATAKDYARLPVVSVVSP
jgi:hypothetical protein